MNRVLAVAAALVLSACGSQTAGAGGGAVASPPTGDGEPGTELYAVATVLEDKDHGPQLCLGGVMESYPPQCGGPELVGWDWEQAGELTRASGTTWGAYAVIGTYDADRDSFTLSRPPVPAEEYDGPRPVVHEEAPRGTPCAVPEGGWQVQDPSLTTQSSLAQVQRVASRLPEFGAYWLDQSINPAYGSEDSEETELALNDPTKLVVNVSVAGDVAEAEAALRQVWGGALCVSKARHTEAELRRIQRGLMATDGALSLGAGHDRVSLTVIHDDGTLQARLDEEHGVGVIEVTSALQPYPG